MHIEIPYVQSPSVRICAQQESEPLVLFRRDAAVAEGAQQVQQFVFC
jgi:hypothetical protein